MILLLALHAIAALLAPALVRYIGRWAFLVLAIVPGAAAVWAATKTSAIMAGEVVTESVQWVPGMGMNLDFRLDTLSWLMTLIVGGVGALVLIYCADYFAAKASGLGRFAGVFVAFAGAMLGLVITDNTLMLYIFWELTSVFSFLLIGHYFERQASRRAAFQALLVTTAGGLAMLAGIIALGQMNGGSYLLSEIVASGQAGELGSGQSTLLMWAIVLILMGALSKSALLPFHFWLPAAMAAPTPVSAYLHAAAMVKGGVYLVARLAPGLADSTAWQILVVGVGLATMLVGGYRALRQHDLKLVLAFGTVSQLGFLIAMVGHGDRAVALAGVALVLSHSLFKSCLFLAVGIIDWSVGTRDLRELSGIGRRMPVLAVVTAVATASMIGLPPTVGFVAKEAGLYSLVDDLNGLASWGALIAVVVGSILTFGYGLRLWWGAFASKPGITPPKNFKTSKLIMAPPVILAAVTLTLGFASGPLERALSPHADQYPGQAGHLTLWGGFSVALALTLVVIVLGVALFLYRTRVEKFQNFWPELGSAEGYFRRGLRRLELVSLDTAAYTQRGSLPAYLGTIFVVLIGGIFIAFLLSPDSLPGVRVWDSPMQLAIGAVVVVGTLLAARARRRIKAVLLLGVVGYAVAVLFALHGAPDLALTQAVVETVTLVVLVLVLRRLPPFFSNRPWPVSRWNRIIIGALAGTAMMIAAAMATSGRIHDPVTVDYPAEVLEFGYGKNIVNVTLVDTRAWDTMGEISVVLAAATGVAALLFIRQRARDLASRPAMQSDGAGRVWGGQQPDLSGPLRRQTSARARDIKVRDQGRNRTWLAGSTTLAPGRRSVILETGARLIFHTLIIYSLFLLFSGHNNPGGGFAGGLAAGIALTVRYLAGGRYELAEALPLKPGHILGGGLVLAIAAALMPVFFGGTILQTTDAYLTLWPFGEMHLASAVIFDVGVYLVVVGLVLDILRSLGAEMDRHGEVEGEQAPEVSSFDPRPASDDIMPPGGLRTDDDDEYEFQTEAYGARGFTRREIAEDTRPPTTGGDV